MKSSFRIGADFSASEIRRIKSLRLTVITSGRIVPGEREPDKAERW